MPGGGPDKGSQWERGRQTLLNSHVRKMGNGAEPVGSEVHLCTIKVKFEVRNFRPHMRESQNLPTDLNWTTQGSDPGKEGRLQGNR